MYLKKDFEVIEHTADAGIQAYGGDLAETFANAARGMFSLITDLDKVKTPVVREVEVSGADREMLLIEWLNELVYVFDVDNIIFKKCEITSLTDTKLKAICAGEKVDKSRHELKVGIKSATYHMLKIEKNSSGKGYQAQVLFDI